MFPRSIARRFFLATLVILTLSAFGHEPAVAKKLYSYQDETGQWVFSDTKPNTLEPVPRTHSARAPPRAAPASTRHAVGGVAPFPSTSHALPPGARRASRARR
ncbi:MAG: DUF4124 domain-containing protein, partial [Pseudomonadota bacterium]